MRRVDLNLDGLGRGRVLVNGTDVSNLVVGLTLEAAPGRATRLVLDLDPSTVSASVDGATISVSLADLLVELGWSRPGDPS